MDFSSVIATMNTLLGKYQPRIFNSSWIRTHAPHCYRFIRKNLRSEFGRIDWDRFTYALDPKFQRRWKPARRKKIPVPYENQCEVDTILRKYRDKMYVFLTSLNQQDRRIRDVIGIKFVRLAQNGNLLARQKLVGLIKYTIDHWIERDYFLSRWRGHEDEIQKTNRGVYSTLPVYRLIRQLSFPNPCMRGPRHSTSPVLFLRTTRLCNPYVDVLTPHLPGKNSWLRRNRAIYKSFVKEGDGRGQAFYSTQSAADRCLLCGLSSCRLGGGDHQGVRDAKRLRSTMALRSIAVTEARATVSAMGREAPHLRIGKHNGSAVKKPIRWMAKKRAHSHTKFPVFANDLRLQRRDFKSGPLGFGVIAAERVKIEN
jgi:hypothetical protein